MKATIILICFTTCFSGKITFFCNLKNYIFQIDKIVFDDTFVHQSDCFPVHLFEFKYPYHLIVIFGQVLGNFIAISQ